MPTHVIAVDGQTADPNTGNVPVPVTVYQLKTTLTDAQIKDLPTTYVELVPAPGLGKTLIFHSAALVWKCAGGAYAENAKLLITYDDYNAEASVLFPLSNQQNTAMSIAPASAFVSLSNSPWLEQPVPFNTDWIVNVPLKIGMLSPGTPFTGGHASNTLEVTVFYSIVDL